MSSSLDFLGGKVFFKNSFPIIKLHDFESKGSEVSSLKSHGVCGANVSWIGCNLSHSWPPKHASWFCLFLFLRHFKKKYYLFFSSETQSSFGKKYFASSGYLWHQIFFQQVLFEGGLNWKIINRVSDIRAPGNIFFWVLVPFVFMWKWGCKVFSKVQIPSMPPSPLSPSLWVTGWEVFPPFCFHCWGFLLECVGHLNTRSNH